MYIHIYIYIYKSLGIPVGRHPLAFGRTPSCICTPRILGVLSPPPGSCYHL